MAMVIIPFDWNNLPPQLQAKTIPICIAEHNKKGERISDRWFTEGVAPAYKRLLHVSQRILGDQWRASEITERAVDALSSRHGDDVGISPVRQVIVEATHAARDIRSGKSRADRNHECQPGTVYDQAHTDPRETYTTQIDVTLILKRMHEDGAELEATIVHYLLSGHNYRETAERLGINYQTMHSRMERWIRRNTTHTHGLTGRRRAIPVRAAACGSDAIPESEP